jgi:hypothetical protein
MALLLKASEQTDEGLEVTQTHNGLTSGELNKRISGSEVCPGRREGAHIASSRIVKEDAGFTPGNPLNQERESALEEWMKRMRYGEVNITIQWIGYR